MIECDSTMIPPSIMFRKGDKNITKGMRTILNQLVSIMVGVKAKIGLTKRTRLD
jgi:hypothetical protein